MGNLKISPPLSPAFAAILTPEALAFVEMLENELGERRREL